MTLIISKSIAAILAQSRRPLIIDEIELPSQLTLGQVLVEVITSGICGAQINEIDAVKGPDKFLPHLLGHEGFAKVLEIGPGVTTVAVGDQVVMHWRPGAGIQSSPPQYKWQDQPLNSGWVTTFNQYAVVSENRLTRIPTANHDKTLIPLLGCSLTTALGVLRNEAHVDFNDSLLIFGAGGVGLVMVVMARFLGIVDITVVDIHENKLQKAEELGASKTIKFSNKSETLKQLSEFYRSNLPTVAIDTSGQTSAIEICYEITSTKSRIILVGVPKIGLQVNLYTLPLHFGKSIIGSVGGRSEPQKDIPLILKLISENRLEFKNYPTHIFPLTKINDAITNLKNGYVGRMLVDFSKNQGG